MNKVIWPISLAVGLLLLGAGCQANTSPGAVAPVVSENKTVNTGSVGKQPANPETPQKVVESPTSPSAPTVAGAFDGRAEVKKVQSAAMVYYQSKYKVNLTERDLPTQLWRDGLFARGNAVQYLPPGKMFGQFFAVKISDSWRIVSDGKGDLDCITLKKNSFPKYFITECYTSAELALPDSIKLVNDQKTIVQVRLLQAALKAFKKDLGQYPRVMQNIGQIGFSQCLNKQGFSPAGCASPYLDNIDTAPQYNLGYLYTSNGNVYRLDFGIESNVYDDGELKLTQGAAAATPAGIFMRDRVQGGY